MPVGESDDLALELVVGEQELRACIRRNLSCRVRYVRDDRDRSASYDDREWSD